MNGRLLLGQCVLQQAAGVLVLSLSLLVLLTFAQELVLRSFLWLAGHLNDLPSNIKIVALRQYV